MHYMFKDASAFRQDILKWNTGSVKLHQGMFWNCPIPETNKPLSMKTIEEKAKVDHPSLGGAFIIDPKILKAEN